MRIWCVTLASVCVLGLRDVIHLAQIWCNTEEGQVFCFAKQGASNQYDVEGPVLTFFVCS
jgi:hypothetical protein